MPQQPRSPPFLQQQQQGQAAAGSWLLPNSASMDPVKEEEDPPTFQNPDLEVEPEEVVVQEEYEASSVNDYEFYCSDLRYLATLRDSERFTVRRIATTLNEAADVGDASQDLATLEAPENYALEQMAPLHDDVGNIHQLLGDDLAEDLQYNPNYLEAAPEDSDLDTGNNFLVTPDVGPSCFQSVEQVMMLQTLDDLPGNMKYINLGQETNTLQTTSADPAFLLPGPSHEHLPTEAETEVINHHCNLTGISPHEIVISPFHKSKAELKHACPYAYCRYQSNRICNFKRHLVDIHSDKISTPCCGLLIRQKGLLRLHQELRHKKEDVTTFKVELDPDNEVAMKVGKEIKSFVYPCEICGRAFNRHALLGRHVANVHKKEKSLKCDKCAYASANSSNFARHVQTMHGNGSGKVRKRKREEVVVVEDQYSLSQDLEVAQQQVAVEVVVENGECSVFSF